MDVYIPLATRYRPQKFADVIGQDIAVKILTQGLIKNRLGAAILFSGTRGVGKTTLARILAKAYRCEKRAENEYEPCGNCPSCLEFKHSNQMDVIEIDAASNTSVDDVREIIESCQYKPTTGKFKIFIVDEVHMLSKSAFNALLKTLEEPPEHVKFLFATTETYKIPETVLSRVLKFDLKSLSSDLIAQHLSSICNRENISADANALLMIANAADGSIRDSLSILDQMINVANDDIITVDSIKEGLGLSSENDLILLFEYIAKKDIQNAIMEYRKITATSISCSKIIEALLNCVYLLTCLRTKVSPKENLLSEVSMDILKEKCAGISLAGLSKIWQILIKGAEELKFCEHAEIALEMIIVRIIYAADIPDLHNILNDLNGKIFNVSTNENVVSGNTGIHVNAITSISLEEEARKMFPQAEIKIKE